MEFSFYFFPSSDMTIPAFLFFIFFSPASQVYPCRDPSTVEYNVCDLMRICNLLVMVIDRQRTLAMTDGEKNFNREHPRKKNLNWKSLLEPPPPGSLMVRPLLYQSLILIRHFGSHHLDYYTVEHFIIAAWKKCDPKTMIAKALIATLKKCDLGSLWCLVLGHLHLNCCKFPKNGPILTI